MSKKTAIIIGAGPAGLTAGLELLTRTDILPIILESADQVGGISKTVNFKGNRMDLGGHRFFSKSNKVTSLWKNIFPLQTDLNVSPLQDDLASLQRDNVMLMRKRVSRIFFLRKFFDYPLSLSFSTISNLGFKRTCRIAASWVTSALNQISPEKNLEDFLINRFGKELYLTFFSDYTQKVWGVTCKDIPASWGAQRIRNLSIGKTILHAVKNLLSKNNPANQDKTQTSLIEQFMYPKLGPGQFWQHVANLICSRGGQIHLNEKVVNLKLQNGSIDSVTAKDALTGKTTDFKADYVFSSMPVVDLVSGLGDIVRPEIRSVAAGLKYRDFITVGLLLSDMKIKNETKTQTFNNIIPDNWIYIQEKDVKLGRLQVFNNWSPYMVKDPDTFWLGLEYFCNEGDGLWNLGSQEMAKLAICELEKIEIIDKKHVLDSFVIKVPKAYPAYFGSYDKFDSIRAYLDKIENLFLIGRNGMHRYNNQDHSMLTAMAAVDNIVSNIKTKDNIWQINTEETYHEKK